MIQIVDYIEPAFRFNRCCVCIPIKTGIFIIAVVNITLSVVYLTFTFIAIYNVEDNLQSAYKDDYTPVEYFVGLFFMELLYLTAQVLLIVAIFKEIQYFVKTWLLFEVIYFCLVVVLLIINLTRGLKLISTTMGLTLTYILPEIYFILILRSYLIELEMKEMGFSMRDIRRRASIAVVDLNFDKNRSMSHSQFYDN